MFSINRVQKEVDTIFDSGHDLTDFQDLDQLELTHDVLRETLRLYPPAPLLFRQPTEDFDVAGLAVPGGTGVSVSFVSGFGWRIQNIFGMKDLHKGVLILCNKNIINIMFKKNT